MIGKLDNRESTEFFRLTLIPRLILDTNILMEIDRIDEFDWGMSAIDLVILDPVIEELRGLMRDQANREKARRAQHAYGYLDALAKKTTLEGLPLRKGQVRLFFSRAPLKVNSSLDPKKVDHQIIEFSLQCMREEPERFSAVVTIDREMADLCLCQDPVVQAISPSKERLKTDIPLFVQRRLDVFIQQHNGPTLLPRLVATQIQQNPDQSRTRKRPLVDPMLRLNRLVGNFHSKIIAAHHRAILTLSPFQARLALTAR